MKQIEIKISNHEIDYEGAVMYMESRVNDISTNQSKELLWFLSHNHIFTQGTSASKEEVLNSDIIDVIKTNRGGKTTYHGPGQRIVYFMLNLNNKNKDIRKFITIIEESLITFLAHYNVEAQAFKDSMTQVVLLYLKQAIASDRATVAGLLQKQGHKDMADIIRRL